MMVGEIYEYQCECGFSIRADTWDPQELPRLLCPKCSSDISPDDTKRLNDETLEIPSSENGKEEDGNV